MSNELTSQFIVKQTQKLLDAIVNKDWKIYQQLCDISLTAFEPEGMGTLIEGLSFHKFFFDNGTAVSTGSIQVSIQNPRVRLISGMSCAIIAYVRFIQKVDSNGKITMSRSEETRVWEKKGSEWKHVHFHRSKL